ncbi:hypothetical protein ElyMa_006388900 [Elysia marginata]|uniref:Uncharacterized protein n=1 Tax=Elysia marginata TaxID=1093978 RepID=A0AAV4HSB5_9GAST|nr:hypothetical protein ElyMa_006388900 [Elysia marginata]
MELLHFDCILFTKVKESIFKCKTFRVVLHIGQSRCRLNDDWNAKVCSVRFERHHMENTRQTARRRATSSTGWTPDERHHMENTRQTARRRATSCSVWTPDDDITWRIHARRRDGGLHPAVYGHQMKGITWRIHARRRGGGLHPATYEQSLAVQYGLVNKNPRKISRPV